MTLHYPDLAVDALRPGDDGYDDAARVFFATGEPVPAGDVRPPCCRQAQL